MSSFIRLSAIVGLFLVGISFATTGSAFGQGDSIYQTQPSADLTKSLHNNLKEVTDKWPVTDALRVQVEKLVRSIDLEKPGESRPIRLEMYKAGAGSIPVLASMAESKSEDDRRKALIGVIWIWQMPSMELEDRKIVTPAITDTFRRSYLDKSVKVRVAAIRGLGSIGRRLQKDAPTGVMLTLEKALEDPDKQVAGAARSEIEMIKLVPPAPKPPQSK